MNKSKNILIIAFASFFIGGCQQSIKDTAPVDTHEHESITSTIFTPELELFTEFAAFTLHHSSDILVHITNLADYKPMLEGELSLSITGANTRYNKTLGSPSSPGIYRFTFAPDIAENINLKISFRGEEFNINSQQIFKNDGEAEAYFESLASHGYGSEDITFTKEQSWGTDFQTMELTANPFNYIIMASGKLEALPTAKSSLIAPTEGLIEFNGNLIPGQKVKKGEILFIVESGDLTSTNLKTRYATAKAVYNKANIDYKRAEELVKDNIISDKDFQEVKLNYETAQLEFEAISKNFSNGKRIIKASKSGIISSIEITRGEFVTEGQKIAQIIQTNKLILKADISQKNIQEAKNIFAANFKIGGAEKLYSTQELNGKILSYSSLPSADNAYIPIYFEIDNPGDLTANLFAEVFLQTNATENKVTIPLSALIESESHFHVYVQENGETYISKDVFIGGNDGEFAIVLSGLEAGDRIVTKGAYRIKLASLSGELPSHGHVH